ncbi:MAG: adenosylcobinamide-GDP ribazoletransferase, partial [Tannerellaceae bacterium]
LHSLPIELIGCALLAGDPYAKGVSAMIINRLPYARTAEEAKNKTVYSRMTAGEYVFSITCGMAPLLWLPKPIYLWAALAPVITWYLLTSLMKRKLQGYTGDCCGATFLLCELSFYLAIVILHTTLL